jgi:broad specificity phosphatase PhoE
VLDGLAEVHHGTFAGLTNKEIETRYPGELGRRECEKYTWRFPGGESYADADARVRVALNQVTQAEARSPVLVTHEMVGRMFLRALLGLSPGEALSWSLPHGAIVDVSPMNGTATVISATQSATD